MYPGHSFYTSTLEVNFAGNSHNYLHIICRAMWDPLEFYDVFVNRVGRVRNSCVRQHTMEMARVREARLKFIVHSCASSSQQKTHGNAKEAVLLLGTGLSGDAWQDATLCGDGYGDKVLFPVSADFDTFFITFRGEKGDTPRIRRTFHGNLKHRVMPLESVLSWMLLR